MEILTDKDIMDAQRQTPPVSIDGIGVRNDPMGKGALLVLRKASNSGMKMYCDDAESMLNALRTAVSKLESSM